MSRILVAVSSPLASRRIGDAVADLARRLDAEVVVVHVSRPSSPGKDDDQGAGEQAVRVLADHVRVKDVAVQTLLLFADDVPRAILNVAEERKATLLLLGLTGRSVWSRMLAGNVPAELIRNTKIPVLLLPTEYGGAI
jgi:nucleotide-binding universal stress UspA family protein